MKTSRERKYNLYLKIEIHHMQRAHRIKTTKIVKIFVIVENEIYIVCTAFGNLSIAEFSCELVFTYCGDCLRLAVCSQPAFTQINL